MTTVDTDSALLHLGAAIEKKIPVDADHTEMVKFKNRQNQAYSSTLLYLQEFERDLKIPTSTSSGRHSKLPSLIQINLNIKSLLADMIHKKLERILLHR
jgi:hypothetical protein